MKDQVFHDLAETEASEKEKLEKQKKEQEKGLQLGPNLPSQNLTISVQTNLNNAKDAPAEPAVAEKPAEPAVAEKPAEKQKHVAAPQCTAKPKYTAKRKPLFASPAKRQIIRGIDLISGKKKRGKK